MIQKNSAKKKVVWNDNERQHIAHDIYDKLMEDVTAGFFEVIKEHCANLEQKPRTIQSLTQVPWLVKLIRRIHNDRINQIHKNEHELNKLKNKAEVKPMSDLEKLQEMPTEIIFSEVMGRVFKRIDNIEKKLERKYPKY